MDRLEEHKDKMKEIQERAITYHRTNSAVRDIAEALYDVIERVQKIEERDSTER